MADDCNRRSSATSASSAAPAVRLRHRNGVRQHGRRQFERQQRPMIAIGVQMGGPEQKNSAIRDMLMVAMNAAIRVRQPNYNNGASAWINPIFIVPGSILKPEFFGYELGHFSKKEKGLVIKIAVPQSVANGEGVVEFIIQALREAIRLASERFKLRSIDFSTLKAEKLSCRLKTLWKSLDEIAVEKSEFLAIFAVFRWVVVLSSWITVQQNLIGFL